MNVRADFYTTDSDNRSLHKNLTGVFGADFVYYEDSSIINPVLRLAYNSAIKQCNYIFIGELNRYYFIDNIRFNRGGEMFVSCHIDVLTTYASEIERIQCTIARYEHYNLTTLPDTNVVIKNYDIINIYQSDKGFDTTFGNYVLQILGG